MVKLNIIGKQFTLDLGSTPVDVYVLDVTEHVVIVQYLNSTPGRVEEFSISDFEYLSSPKGVIYIPYTIETTSTSINNTTVWYKNKWKNFWLRVKFFFKKPNELRCFENYSKKPINTEYYQTIGIKQ